MLKAIGFDLDDTLIDGKKMHHAAIIEALNKFGYKKKRIKWIRGATTEELLKLNFPTMNEKMISKIALYKRKIVKKYMNLAKVLPHARELLRTLKQKGLIVGMITNNSRIELKHFLKYFKIKKYFDIVVGIDDAKPKPNSDMLKIFMKRAKVKPKEMIYVGDSDYDILACKKAKIDIILNTKIHKTKLMSSADYIAKNLKDIKDIIMKLEG